MRYKIGDIESSAETLESIDECSGTMIILDE